MVSQEGKVANMERDVKGRLCPQGIGAEPPQHHGRVTWECCSWGMGTSAGTSVVWLCRASVQSGRKDSQQVLAGTHKLEIGICLDLHGGLRCPWAPFPQELGNRSCLVCPAPSRRKIGCCFKPGQTEELRSSPQGRWKLGEIIWKIKQITGNLGEKH